MRVSSEERLNPVVDVIRNDESGELPRTALWRMESNALEKSSAITMIYHMGWIQVVLKWYEELDECTGGGAGGLEGKLI